MAPSKTTDPSAKLELSVDTVAVLLMAAKDSGTTISRYYSMMSKVDGSRTASSFEHQFRSIHKRAEELIAMRASGELDGGEVKSKPKRALPVKKMTAPAAGSGKTARGKRGRATEDDDNDEEVKPVKIKKEEVEQLEGPPAKKRANLAVRKTNGKGTTGTGFDRPAAGWLVSDLNANGSAENHEVDAVEQNDADGESVSGGLLGDGSFWDDLLEV